MKHGRWVALLLVVPSSVTADESRRADCPGETLAEAIPITALPFTATGSTCGCSNDLEAPCLGDRGQPDVVFAYTPAVDACLRLDLCASSYDTVLYVYEDSLAFPVACNDESCGAQSYMPELQVTAGRTYFVVVDGGGACGDYTLVVEACRPCVPDCPPGAVAEGEPDCSPEYIDHYNPGCSVMPPRFQDLACSDSTTVVCGKYGFYSLGVEMDWYRVTLEAPGRLESCVFGEGTAQLVLWDANCGRVICDVLADPCGSVCCSEVLAPGSYAVLVRPAITQQTVPCGSAYRLEIAGYDCRVAVQLRSWSGVRRLFW
jgi:hypothetical protein